MYQLLYLFILSYLLLHSAVFVLFAKPLCKSAFILFNCNVLILIFTFKKPWDLILKGEGEKIGPM